MKSLLLSDELKTRMFSYIEKTLTTDCIRVLQWSWNTVSSQSLMLLLQKNSVILKIGTTWNKSVYLTSWVLYVWDWNVVIEHSVQNIVTLTKW